MRIAFDTSAFAKRYIEEAGSDKVEHLLQQASQIGLSILCAPELISALNRRRRERTLTVQQYHQIKVALQADITDATILNITPPIVEVSTALLEDNILRALDALHIASAVLWQADLFVTADERQLRAAERAGLAVQAV